jgi:hypothetical protein
MNNNRKDFDSGVSSDISIKVRNLENKGYADV